MDNKETFEELEQLKSQMSVLKKRLKEDPIVADEQQILRVAKEYKYGRIYWGIIAGVLVGLSGSFGLWRELFSGEHHSIVLIVVDIVVALLAIGFWVCYCTDLLYSHYTIDNENLVVRSGNLLLKGKRVIPIKSIRFIELLNVGNMNGRNVRIVYNKFDDFYLNSPRNSEIVADLLRVNPEIEIRKEKE